MKKLSILNCYKLAKSKGGKLLSTSYINNKTKLKWECATGHTFLSNYNHVSQGRWCPKCALLSIGDAHKIAKNKGGKCLSTSYNNDGNKLLWRCPYGHIWKAKLYKIKDGNWCPECAKNNRKNTLSDCYSLAAKKGGECLESSYINNRTKIPWKCKAKHIFYMSYDKAQRGQWCPQCKISKAQIKIKEIIENIFPNYAVKYNYKNFDWLITKKGYRQELDIYIPELKLAIEYDGEQHFMPRRFGNISEERASNNFEKQKKLDKTKDKKIKRHPEDVKYFIRFNYKDKIEHSYILQKIISIAGNI